jgi:hypothetical protein
MKQNWRARLGLVLGVVATLLGAVLRIEANRLAWPAWYSFTGPRENTNWAQMEAIYRDMGIALLAFGLAVIVACIHKWLWSEDRTNKLVQP